MSSQPASGPTLTTAIRGVSPVSWILAWRLAGVVALTLACAVLAAPGWGADDAVAARERGAAVIDAFVDHYRRTGDPTSKLAELNAMAPELVAAVRTFIARGDNAGAAQTLIPLGDIHRMQGRWELALTAYRMAENVARQAADPTLLARALKVQAQIDSSQRDYSRGLAHVQEALALLRPLPDRKLLGDALLVPWPDGRLLLTGGGWRLTDRREVDGDYGLRLWRLPVPADVEGHDKRGLPPKGQPSGPGNW